MHLSDRFTVQDQAGRSTSIGQAEAALASLGALRTDKWVVLCGEVTTWYVAAVAALIRADVPFLPSDNWPSSNCRDLIDRAGFRGVAVSYLGCDGGISLQAEDSGDYLPDLHGIQCLVTTSGTTGDPKPVVLHSAAVRNSISGLERITGLEPWSGRVLHANNPMFDGFLEEVILTARAGGTLLIPRIPLRLNPLLIPQTIRTELIDVVDLPTGLFNALACAPAPEVFDNNVLFVIGGQQFIDTALARVRAIFPRSRIVNTYGPSEATITCCAYEFNSTDGGKQLIGKPYPGVIWRLGSIGTTGLQEEGQLMLSGVQVSPSATRAESDDGWYLTGDRVRLLKDGVLEYLGRMNSVVKVAGKRVDLIRVSRELEDFLDLRVNVRNETSAEGVDTLVVVLYGAPKNFRAEYTKKTRERLRYLGVPILVIHKSKVNLTSRGKEVFP